MPKRIEVNFYISKKPPKEARKKAQSDYRVSEFYIVDISKIIRELGYEVESVTKESEFIINYTIRKKIFQGIYSTKCDSILVCYKNLPSDFVQSLEKILDEIEDPIEYTIQLL